MGYSPPHCNYTCSIDIYKLFGIDHSTCISIFVDLTATVVGKRSSESVKQIRLVAVFIYFVWINISLLKLCSPRTAVMISIESFPNSLLRAKSIWAFLNLIFCHLLCPLYLNCILEKFGGVDGQQHLVIRAGKLVAITRHFLANVDAILILNRSYIHDSAGRG